MGLVPVASSNVAAVSYNGGTLTVVFGNGSVYLLTLSSCTDAREDEAVTMGERKKSGAQIQAEAQAEAERTIEPGAGMRAYNQAEAEREAQRRAQVAGASPVAPYIVVRCADAPARPVQHIAVRYLGEEHSRAERKVKRHAWSIVGIVRDAQGAITGVQIVCEECGRETVAGLPTDICLG
jgi:hypothetical protein